MSGEEAGYLGEGEDEDQVEEELQGGDPLLAPDPGRRHTSLIGDVHRVDLLSLSDGTGMAGTILPCSGLFATSEEALTR